MSNSTSHAEGESLEILLNMNQQLREEVRAHGKRKSRRYLGSLTILGVLLGYLFTTGGDARVLVLVPFVLGFLFLSHISSMNYVVQLASLLALIEAKINHPGVEYEYYHGGFSISNNQRFADLHLTVDRDSSGSRIAIQSIADAVYERSLNQIEGDPNSPTDLHDTVQSRVRNGMHLLAAISYVGSAVIGALVLWERGVPLLDFGDTISLIAITLILLAQGVLLYQIAVAWNAYRHHRQLLADGVEKVLDKDRFDGGILDIEESFSTE